MRNSSVSFPGQCQSRIPRGQERQLIAATAETENLDTTSLHRLRRAISPPPAAWPSSLEEKEFSILFHEGTARQHPHLHHRPTGDPGGDLRSALIPGPGPASGSKRAPKLLGNIFNQLLQKVETEKGSGKAQILPLPRSPTKISTSFSDNPPRTFPEAVRRGITVPMSFINYSSREINCKIVYYGPGLCGKTTNLQWI